MTTEMYLLLTKDAKLQSDDLETMTVGMVLDYIDYYFEIKHPKKEKVRTASQSDFDIF